MIFIRNRQIKTLGVATREAFLLRMETHLRVNFVQTVKPLPKEALREIIESNWKCADGFGLKSELGVCTFLNAVFTLGETFPTAFPQFDELLHSSRSERDKIKGIEAGVMSILEAQAAEGR